MFKFLSARLPTACVLPLEKLGTSARPLAASAAKHTFYLAGFCLAMERRTSLPGDALGTSDNWGRWRESCHIKAGRVRYGSSQYGLAFVRKKTLHERRLEGLPPSLAQHRAPDRGPPHYRRHARRICT
jgi:hypothetical protein